MAPCSAVNQLHIRILLVFAMPSNEYLLAAFILPIRMENLHTTMLLILSIYLVTLFNMLTVLSTPIFAIFTDSMWFATLCSMVIFHSLDAYYGLSKFVGRIRQHPVRSQRNSGTYHYGKKALE